MATSPRRVYWDACTWIALIQREKIRDDKGVVTEDRDALCRTVWFAAKNDRTTEIVTSALSLVEVCKSKEVVAEGGDKIASFFEHPHIDVVMLERFVGERARELMLAGYSKLKPPDATHLATAALANVDEMHTFDDKLLALNGKILKADGSKLRIAKPDAATTAPLLAQAPLLEEAADEAGAKPEAETDADADSDEGIDTTVEESQTAEADAPLAEPLAASGKEENDQQEAGKEEKPDGTV